MTQLWIPKWATKNRLDGKRSVLVWHKMMPALFRSRRECRDFIEREYGYIKNRPDLCQEPHGWTLPKPVKVIIKEQR